MNVKTHALLSVLLVAGLFLAILAVNSSCLEYYQEFQTVVGAP